MSKAKLINLSQVVTPKLSKGAIIRTDYPGFKEDYLAIHCLIRKYHPSTFMEIGTSSGLGTRVICNAIDVGGIVYSIDVPPGTDSSIIYPEKEDKHPGIAGKYCEFDYVQLYGDSRTFDFKDYYPLEAWFIDGKHNYAFTSSDTRQALKAKPKLIIWHDTQIPDVKRAITDTMAKTSYKLFLINSTRIAFALL